MFPFMAMEAFYDFNNHLKCVIERAWRDINKFFFLFSYSAFIATRRQQKKSYCNPSVPKSPSAFALTEIKPLSFVYARIIKFALKINVSLKRMRRVQCLNLRKCISFHDK